MKRYFIKITAEVEADNVEDVAKIINIKPKYPLFNFKMNAKEIESCENMKYLLKCPYCGFKEDNCFFPDLFYRDDNSSPEIRQQANYQNELQKLGYNIVTCGQCGQVFIERLKK